MPTCIRPEVRGATIFFTAALADRSSDLLMREVGRLREAVRMTREEQPFEIEAWVVLPDHLHALWTLPDGDRKFTTRWGAIKARFTQSLRESCRVGFYPTIRRSASKVAKGDAGIWQRRFWEHHIRDETDYHAHGQNCWSNPVKHGFVERASDWPLGRVEPEWSGIVPEGAIGE